MTSFTKLGQRTNRQFDPDMVLSTLPFAVLAVDLELHIRFLNTAAEHFFGIGSGGMDGRQLGEFVAPHSPLFSLVAQASKRQTSVAEYDVSLSLRNGPIRNLAITAAPMVEVPDIIVVSLHEQSIARQISNQIAHRNAARSVNGLAAILAHEVKNPLSGIKGAAQLLETSVAGGEDVGLTRLICEETDRICDLVDRMGLFSEVPISRSAVNIHQILERTRRIAKAGFGRNVEFIEEYDPSLPPVDGNADQLIQIFLNVVKNACEATPRNSGVIVLRTAYQHGVRLAIPGGETLAQLPLLVSVTDNGPGILPDIAANLFDPFVTSKSGGSGLGLALAAKMVGDHGGIIEFDTTAAGTEFRISLPVHNGDNFTMEKNQ